MLISDMKALRLLQTQKQIFLQNNRTKNPNSLSIISRQNLRCSHHFLSSLRRLHPEASGAEPDSEDTGNDNNDPKVWSFYRPRLGTVVTRTSGAKSGEGKPQPMVDNLSDRDKTKTEFSGSNGGSEDLSIKRKILGNVGNEGLGLVRNGDEEKDAIDGKKYDRGKKLYSSNRVGVENAIGRNNKKKKKTSWVCTDCGHTEAQWWGYCRACGMNGTMKEFSEMGSENGTAKPSGIQVSENLTRSWMPQQPGEAQPLRLADLNQGMNQLDWRIPLSGSFGNEVARVLGGGLVPGSLILVGGDPGVGKSTLLLQIAAIISEGQDLGEPSRVIYVSGEESVEQIGNRAHRLNIQAEELYLYSSTDIEDMLDKSQRMSPRALIVDSIQTVYLKGVAGSAGGLSQVKECTSALLRFAKLSQIPVFLIGHVTKSGDIAGPRLLEHIVDVVLYMEGEKYSSHRLLRPVKNRFGSTDELGVFEMSPSGLQAVSNPSEIFLNKQYSDSKILAGLAVAVIMDGSRSFLIEIQALCVSDPSGSGSRHVNGIQASRADMIISVLMKQASLMLQPNAVFLNVVSGVTLTETAGDLSVAAAICSSFLEFPIPNNVAFIGEIDLAGQIRMVPRIEKRVHTLAKLGYKTCIVPKTAVDLLINLGFEEIEIIGCNNLKEVINTVFEARKGNRNQAHEFCKLGRTCSQ